MRAAFAPPLLRRIGAGRAATPAVLVAVSTLAAVLVTGCTNSKSAPNRNPHTGSGTASSVGGVQQITLTAGDDYRFHPSTFTVHAGGKVEVLLKHTGKGAPHNWQLTQFPADFVPLVQPGQTSRATFVAPSPGRYQFICTIHVQQGQTGTMIVTK